MALSKEIYREFEDVVGKENICDDPLIMPAYYNVKFLAIVLPGNTAEVQAIVKLCNKHKLPFRAICTGWTGTFPNGLILMDLRRMNKIIEINEENMYAVVEPYVISAELQAELFKRGLNVCIKGAGSNCSAMLRGHGAMDQSTSGDDRNHLAIEWVTPSGELVRSGSLGSSDEWFSGDGPGPSLRSILTSAVPPGVTPGVFTKAAVKVYPWTGPAQYALEGNSPRYIMKEIPANLMGRYYSFPSVDQMWNAELKLGENEICYALYGFNAAMVSANMSTSNEERNEVFAKISQEMKGPGFFVIIAGNSAADFAYKKKALEKIVSDESGESVKMIEDNPDIEGILICQNTRISGAIRETFRPGGAFKSIPIMGQRDVNIQWAIGAGEAKKPLITQGLILDDGGAFFGWGVEQGHLGKTEIFCAFNPTNKVAEDAVLKWQAEQTDRAFRENYFASTMTTTPEINQALCNYHDWWSKITRAMDPNGVSPESGSLV
ncbi:MAG: FAD-binding protein [Dehalococcoidales bacterium]|nr:FAD-binding protein [Dehalococcoidales bacterium]